MKIPIKKIQKKVSCYEKIKKQLKKDHACYVLITCSQPSEDGKMQVELNYSGDENLAAYLVDGAKCVFDTDFEGIKKNC